MTDIDALLERAESEPVPKSDLVDVTLAGELVTLRFTRLPGKQWGAITAMCPPNIAEFLDREYGYGVRNASLAAAPLSGVRVTPAGDVALTAKQWERILNTLPGHDLTKISEAVWDLNEWTPQKRIIELKKASPIVSEPNSGSPESSASPTVA